MKKMRQQFVDTVTDVMKKDKRLALLLGDIGVHGFRDVLTAYSERAYNIGILEQSTISMAAGLSMAGFIPVVHTIAPFIVERGLEQLKDDFGYQKLGGNFVTVGASYDFAIMGCTHHCPGDVGILKNVPSMSIILPGTSKEFDLLFKEAYTHPNPTYYRLSEITNAEDRDVSFGKANIVKKGKKATVIAVGPLLQPVLEATADLDVAVLYYTTIEPFDGKTLRRVAGKSAKIVLCEPYYVGALTRDVAESLKGTAFEIEHIGVPHRFLTNYGNMHEHNQELGLTAPGIRAKILKFIK